MENKLVVNPKVAAFVNCTNVTHCTKARCQNIKILVNICICLFFVF